MALNITSSDGQQTTISNPQSAPAGTPGTPAASGAVQPGTADTLLKSQQGVDLGNPALTTVTLNGDPSQLRTQTQSAAGTPAQPQHHVSAAWLAIPVIFVLVAAGMFVAMSRSAKSTTN